MHYYFFPAGAADKAGAIRKIMAHAAGHPYRISLMSAEQKQTLESLFPGQFLYTPERDAYEYIYNAGDLISLSGRKYHGKRNHISKFYREVGDSTLFEPITNENIVDCKTLITNGLRVATAIIMTNASQSMRRSIILMSWD